ncbi:MAG: hypothetical protein IR153_10035 [Flavobacterium sp.]|nr:hypothetical protein [Flavobacterium sp.]
MKKIIKISCFLVLGLIIISCNPDDNSVIQTDEFIFNINSGNKWVYKHYNSPNDSGPFTFTGAIDSIEIVGTEVIQGYTFAIKNTRKFHGNQLSQNDYSYLRVNSLGHLVQITDIENIGLISDTTGFVLHPGIDANYTYNYDVNGDPNIGNVEFHLGSPITINIEEEQYLVSPFLGLFTPSENSPQLVSKTVGEYYASNIGMIKGITKLVVGDITSEYRLVSYEVN